MGESSRDQRSVTEKGVSPRLWASFWDEFHKKNEPYTSIFSGGFPAIGTSAFGPDVAVEVNKPHIYPMWVDFKSSEEDEPVANEMFATDHELLLCRVQEETRKIYRVFEVLEPVATKIPFKFCTFAMPHELLARGGEEEIRKLSMYSALEHGKASFQAPKDPNGSFASEGGAHLMTGIGLVEHGKPLLMKGIDCHCIDIPARTEHDSPGCRFLGREQGQNLRGKVAMLCAGVSAQTILGLAQGAGVMNLPKPIFYSAAAANAIAFGGSALALLLIKKKPHAASILEMVGFASAIATFLLMMSAFMPWK